MLDLETLKYTHYNERDIEIPEAQQYVAERVAKGDINTLFDVGAHYSYNYYAQSFRDILGQEKAYHAIDVLDCPETTKIVDSYFVNNVMNLTSRPTYDIVTCISTLEHVGIYEHIEGGPTEDHINSKKSFVVQLYALAKKGLFITFPYGKEGIFRPHYANITHDFLDFMGLSGKVRGYGVSAHWYYNEFPQGKEQWKVISEADADNVILEPSKGVQCVCIFSASRT